MRSRWLRNPFAWLAGVVLLVGLVLPMGAMLVRSVLFYEVVQKDGRVFRAIGEVIETEDGFRFDIQSPGQEEKISWTVDPEDWAETRTVWSLDHYRRVFSDERTLGLLENSAQIARWGALLALLIGLPMAWILARTALRGRLLLSVLCLGPAVLPPFFVALGGAREMQAVLMDVGGLSGAALQTVNSIFVFGCVLFPLFVLLVGPAMAAVPAGPWEAARLLRGREVQTCERALDAGFGLQLTPYDVREDVGDKLGVSEGRVPGETAGAQRSVHVC